MEMNELESWAKFAEDIGDEAGTMMRAGLHARTHSLKSDGSSLTDIDEAIQAYITERIHERYPSHQVLGEEGGDELTDSQALTWVLDPIDGTFPYSAGLGIATTSLALVEKGSVLVAMIHDPWTNCQYVATAKGATTRNGEIVRVSQREELIGARVAVEGPDELYQALRAAGVRVMGVGASARVGASVADGGLDALVTGPSSPWDVAASMLLVERAGGIVTAGTGAFVHAAKKTPALVMAGTGELASSLRGILEQR